MKILLAGALIVAIAMITPWGSSSHQCKFENCPFKEGFDSLAIQNDCDNAPCRYIDSLHMIHPNLEYDELEVLYEYHTKPMDDSLWVEWHQ
jgi:hypothetical protein